MSHVSNNSIVCHEMPFWQAAWRTVHGWIEQLEKAVKMPMAASLMKTAYDELWDMFSVLFILNSTPAPAAAEFTKLQARIIEGCGRVVECIRQAGSDDDEHRDNLLEYTKVIVQVAVSKLKEATSHEFADFFAKFSCFPPDEFLPGQSLPDLGRGQLSKLLAAPALCEHPVLNVLRILHATCIDQEVPSAFSLLAECLFSAARLAQVSKTNL